MGKRTVTLKLDEKLYRRLLDEAERQRTTKSNILREAFERSLDGAPPKQSLLDQMEDLIGISDGPRDLSTNKDKYLKGYGE